MIYKYLLVDAQWLLTRNFKMKCNNASEGEMYTVNGEVVGDENNKPIFRYNPNFTASELATVFFQSIAKFTYEIVDVEKVILLWDKYPYHKLEILEDYKGTREYPTQDEVDKLDPIKDAKEIVEKQLAVDQLAIKQEAKWLIINEFGKIGLPSIFKTGYEADDFAGIISKYLYENDPESTNLLWSIDSDWDYLTQPNTSHIRPNGKVTTYDDIMKSIEGTNMTPYEYKSYVDSLGGSHNDLVRTYSDKADELNWNQLVVAVRDGKDEYLQDKGLFEAQLKSFKVTEYPDYDTVKKMMYYIDKDGSVMDELDFTLFALEHNLNISQAYYSRFADKLNKKLYKQ